MTEKTSHVIGNTFANQELHLVKQSLGMSKSVNVNILVVLKKAIIFI